MSHAILCDGCHRILTPSEVKIVAADVSIKDNPDRMHLCEKCCNHALRFLGDLRAVQSGGVVSPDLQYITGYLDALREQATKE